MYLLSLWCKTHITNQLTHQLSVLVTTTYASANEPWAFHEGNWKFSNSVCDWIGLFDSVIHILFREFTSENMRLNGIQYKIQPHILHHWRRLVTSRDSYQESVAISATVIEETVGLQGPVLMIRSQDQHKWNVKEKALDCCQGYEPLVLTKNICYSHNFVYVLPVPSTCILRLTAMLKVALAKWRCPLWRTLSDERYSPISTYKTSKEVDT